MTGTPSAAAVLGPSGTQDRLPVRTGLVLLVMSAAVFLASPDLCIVDIAFPAIGDDFAADTAGLSWVLNACTIGFAALLAPAGRTADRIGRRRVLLVGLGVFVLASLGCATAWDVGSLTGAGDALDGARRGWLLVVVVTALAGVTAALVGRAHHPDLAMTATSAAPRSVRSPA